MILKKKFSPLENQLMRFQIHFWKLEISWWGLKLFWIQENVSKLSSFSNVAYEFENIGKLKIKTYISKSFPEVQSKIIHFEVILTNPERFIHSGVISTNPQKVIHSEGISYNTELARTSQSQSIHPKVGSYNRKLGHTIES